MGTAVLLLLAGVAVWGVGLFGVGRTGEDLCLADMVDRGYGAASTRGELWPPRAECVLRGPQDDSSPERLVVSHPVTAWGRTAVVVGLPVLWVVGTGAAVAAVHRRAGP